MFMKLRLYEELDEVTDQGGVGQPRLPSLRPHIHHVVLVMQEESLVQELTGSLQVNQDLI